MENPEIIKWLEKRSKDEGECEGNSLYRDAAAALKAATLTAAEDLLYVRRMEAERDAALLVIAEIQSSGNDCDSNDEFDLLLFAGDTFRILASHSEATA